MKIDSLLAHLEGVRATGRARWIARCPAHDDRSPSLSIRELDDGRILLHDFGGCGVIDVLSAIGLDFAALYPDHSLGDKPRERRPFDALQILQSIAFEALVVATAAENLASGAGLTETDRARVAEAAAKLNHASEVARGR